MKKISLFWLSALLITTPLLAQSGSGTTDLKLTKDNVKQVVAAMTLQEKCWLVVGTGMVFHIPDSLRRAFGNRRNPFETNEENMDPVYKSMLEKIRPYVDGAAGRTAEIDRLGIPTMVVTDGPAGMRISPKRENDPNTYYCTAFPVATLLASSWDTNLVYKVGEAMGNEVHEYGADALLAPAMNIQRNPLCGRNFEYYSEDPRVAGEMAAAMIRGIQSDGVGTSLKHFDANNQETDRNTVNEIISQRALREIYLEGFRIAVEQGKPWTVMSSYNKINGTYTSESEDLLTKILRDDWGYKGYVMTDWGGGTDPVAQMIAGNDLLMPGSSRQITTIMEAVKSGKLDEKILDRNVESILNIIVETPHFKDYKFTNKPDLTAHAQVTRTAAAEGMVLLKNDNMALPLNKKDKKIAAFGNTSYDIIAGGTGSGDVNEAYTIDLVQGLANGGYTLDASLQKSYTDYVKEETAKQPRGRFSFMRRREPIPEMEITGDLANKMADQNDIALITIGRNSGEGADRKVENDFNLSDKEKDMMKTVTDAFHAKGKKVVVILNIGGVIETASWKNIPDAILLAWQPGQEAGNSITDVLSGKVDPSGKLAVTFPVSYDDVPSSDFFPGYELINPMAPKDTGRFSFMHRTPAEAIYHDGIYVGYRYYDTYNVPVSYEFGYGMSYTNFTYSNLKLSSKDFNNEITVTVDIKNTGKAAGKEVVELYLHAPSGNLDKPAEELKGFAKTDLLKPGKSQTLTFTITGRDLSSFDTTSSSFVAAAGTYTVMIGASSIDIKLKDTFNLANNLVVKKVSNALRPHREFAEFDGKNKVE